MINATVKTVKLSDLASWERSNKNKIYPAGCTLLQVSATKGQLVYLDQDQEVDSKYCVIIPDRDQIQPLFLFRALQSLMPEFLHKEQTGLNIRPDILKRFEIKYFPDQQIQKHISKEQAVYSAAIKHAQDVADHFEDLKKYLLQVMFC